MNAIFGLYGPDGYPVDEHVCRTAIDTMQRRGGDVSGWWHQESVVLGCRISGEPLQPVRDHGRSTIIVADARIDNRSELIAQLGAPVTATDEALILSAYGKWGVECTNHLLGDFAFMLWDPVEQKMFCARDHFGVRPLYYTFNGERFACASEIKALLALPDVSRQLSDVAIANYLHRIVDDPSLTFFENILRLPPAHRLMMTRGELHIERYWTPDPEREITCGSDEEYAEAYLEHFTASVQCRMSTVLRTGATLSGGLDSSSIVGVARTINGGLLLPTFSAVFDEVPESNERSFIESVIAQGGIDPSFVRADRIRPLDGIEEMFDYSEQPFDAPNFFVHWNLYRTASQRDVGVILDGNGGDIVVSHGIARLAELFRKGQLFRLSGELRSLSQELHRPVRRLFMRHALRPFIPARIRSYRAMKTVRTASDEPFWSIGTVIAPEFAESIAGRVEEQVMRQWNAPPPSTARQAQFRELMGDLISSELELFNKSAAGMGIESRHPFFDRRLVEFCLALPGDQKLHEGWTRAVARRAMQNILPKDLCWRRGKGDFAPNFIRSMMLSADILKTILEGNQAERLKPYVRTTELRAALDRVSQKVCTHDDAYNLWKAAALALWLQRH